MYKDESVEKIVQDGVDGISGLFNGDVSRGQRISDHVRSAIRQYGEWMARKRCDACADGLPRHKAGPIHWHQIPNDFEYMCKVSFIWESLEEK